jgi:hypothetical protein
MFENRVLRRIFGPRSDGAKGEWRKLHTGKLHNLYSSPNIIRQIKSRIMRLAGHVARMVGESKVCKVLVGKPEGKDYSEDRVVDGQMVSKWSVGTLTGWGGGAVDWIHLAENRDWWRVVVNTVMKLWVLASRSFFN